MTDRPILFSAPMVQALLAGRKTQTRRMLKPQPDSIMVQGKDRYFASINGEAHFVHHRFIVGDRLWVRETFAERIEREAATYRADVPNLPIQWKPSIFMPRWASRITLLVTDVRVERLQDISERDAIAEGIGRYGSDSTDFAWKDYSDNGLQDAWASPVESYRTLWDHINGQGAWDQNPWVVAVTFEVIQRNIDWIE